MKKTITEMFYDLPGSREYIERLAEGEKPGNLSDIPSDRQPDDPEPTENPDNPDSTDTSITSDTSVTSDTSDTSNTSVTSENPENPDKTDVFLLNMAESLQLMRGFAAGRGLSSETLDSVLLSLFRLTRDTAQGIVNIENIEKLLKALTYDHDMANARYEGEIAGRNARIEIEMRKTTDSDGVPRMSGKSTSGSSSLPGSIFDLVRSARD